MKLLKTAFCLLIFIKISNSTLSQSDKKAKKEPKVKEAKSGPDLKSVYAKGLVTTKINSKSDLLENYNNYHQDTSFHNFDGTVLGYVTPWNSHGYDIAKTFSGKKLNLISPVWLQISPNDDSYKVTGLHDKDSKWMHKVKKSGAKILPRILFDKWTGNDYVKLFTDQKRVAQMSQILVELCSKNDFDGLTLEVWSQLGKNISVLKCFLNQKFKKRAEINLILA